MSEEKTTIVVSKELRDNIKKTAVIEKRTIEDLVEEIILSGLLSKLNKLKLKKEEKDEP